MLNNAVNGAYGSTVGWGHDCGLGHMDFGSFTAVSPFFLVFRCIAPPFFLVQYLLRPVYVRSD